MTSREVMRDIGGHHEQLRGKSGSSAVGYASGGFSGRTGPGGDQQKGLLLQRGWLHQSSGDRNMPRAAGHAVAEGQGRSGPCTHLVASLTTPA